ncbi:MULTISPECIES: GntR family transcriptional regulator [Paenibacillus]|uniref:LacI family transcriptional regulator n=1 Tax=Paenibacillus albilobatus TaxID=2716884 RepID=A0A919XK89_9BACL|nr:MULTISPECIES: GntR family transcriptional regulator [Paenibacillus]MDR9852351.1 GntR family transcriptional regulator [Paenibacillus sp. VCA1]GIO32385.1 LacI family transcriptional regulator [Paenibacillus albilobatus]
MSHETSSKPMYEQIFEALRDQIISRKYAPGERIPSEKELGEAYNVSRITSKKALEMLTQHGYIVRQPGRGSFVSEDFGSEGAAQGAMAQGAAKPRIHRDKPLIGLVMTDFGDSYGTGLIYGMEEASRQHDGYLVLRRSLGVVASEEEAIRGLLELGVDGLIIFPAQGEYFNAEILKLVIGQYPFVLLDRHLKGVSASSISTDNAAAAKRMIEYLFELGHTRISLMTPPPQDTTAIEDRIEGFIQAHAESGIAADRSLWMERITATLPAAFVPGNKEKEKENIKQHLREHPEITALFAMEYNIALLAYEAARESGLRVPEDLSIVCFDSPDYAGEPLFTHMRQKQEEMGRLAFENVLKLRNGESVPNKMLLDAELIVGSSSGPAREG